MNHQLGVVILAAGQGTRMRSRRPKVLHQLAGRSLLGRVIDSARRLQPARIIVIYGHGGDQVKAAIEGEDIRWVEQAEQLGTGHAVMQALPELQGVKRVLVLYGDVPLVSDATLGRLLAAQRNCELALLTVDVEDPQGYGRILRDEQDNVCAIVEHKDASPMQLLISEINTGIMVADQPSLLGWLARLKNDNAQGEFYLTDIVEMAVAEGGQVHAAQPEDEQEVAGINDPMQLAQLERYYQQRQAQRLMAAGVTLRDPARFDLRGQLECGMDVEIDINLVVEGKVNLGDGVRIGPNCVIQDCHIDADVEIGPNCILRHCRIAKGVHIHPNSLLEEAEVGEQSRIGPFARLRPESRLADHVHVGNFVEIKKSDVASGSKINHLSYIGDTSIGCRVNVGAGTITCNYDGANKHRTEIGDDAFIGSDTQLVAPVKVGRGATIGAGSTITRDTPEDQLTLCRATTQLSLKQWKRPVKK